MDNLTQKITPILKKYNIKKAALFGSYARGDYNEKSDIDILIDYKETPTLFEMARLQNNLQDTLGRKVDLVIRKNVKPLLLPYIMNDLIPLYEEN